MFGVFLDFGGTLDGDGAHWSTQLARAFAGAGLSVERKRLDAAFLESDRWLERTPGIANTGLERHVALQVERMLETLELGRSVRDDVVDAFMRAARDCLARNRQVLERHRAHCRYWVISNFTPNLPSIVAESGLGDLIEGTTCSAIEGVTKPNPALFQAALRDSGYALGSAVMAGDSLSNDIMPAKALGMTTLWIRADEVRSGDPRAADYVAPDLALGFELLAAKHFSRSVP